MLGSKQNYIIRIRETAELIEAATDNRSVFCSDESYSE